MTYTTADLLLDRLHAWGVRRFYGHPGDGIDGIMGALADRTEKIEFVQSRHEETSAFMACAHAKLTGELGVCLATSGPGPIHLLSGPYDARMDHQPVLAIVGRQARLALGGHYQQELDLLSLFKDVASMCVHVCAHPAQMRHLVRRSIRPPRHRAELEPHAGLRYAPDGRLRLFPRRPAPAAAHHLRAGPRVHGRAGPRVHDVHGERRPAARGCSSSRRSRWTRRCRLMKR